QLERVVELRVGAELALLDVRRRPLGGALSAGRGLALLPFLVFTLPAAQVARQVRLAQQRAIAALVALGEHGRLLHHDVGDDAGRLDRPAARREVAGGRVKRPPRSLRRSRTRRWRPPASLSRFLSARSRSSSVRSWICVTRT